MWRRGECTSRGFPVAPLKNRVLNRRKREFRADHEIWKRGVFGWAYLVAVDWTKGRWVVD